MDSLFNMAKDGLTGEATAILQGEYQSRARKTGYG
jgi:hypothetical protein